MRKSVTDSEIIAWIGYIFMGVVIFSLWEILSGTVTFDTGVTINGENFPPLVFPGFIALGVFLVLRWIAHRRPDTMFHFVVHKLLSLALLAVVLGAFGSWIKPLGVYYSQIGFPLMPFNALTASTVLYFFLVACFDIREHHMTATLVGAGKQTTPAADMPTDPLHPLPDSTEPPVFAAGEPRDHHRYGGRIINHWDSLDAPPRHAGIWEGERPARIARGRATITLDDDAAASKD